MLSVLQGRGNAKLATRPEMPTSHLLTDVIRSGMMTITPTFAARVLKEAGFERQRTIAEHHVALLTASKAAGRFTRGTQVHFARQGTRLFLINGNHRLAAVVQSGMPTEFQILVTDVTSPDEVVTLYYRHDGEMRPRSMSDAMVAAGIDKQYDLPVPFAKAVFGAAFLLAHRFNPPHYSVDPVAVQSRDVRLENAHPWWPFAQKFFDMIDDHARTRVRQKLSTAGVLAVALATIRHHPKKAEEFWTGVSKDDGLRRDDPRKALLITWAEGGRKTGAIDVAKIAATAWNAHYQDKSLRLIRTFDGSPVVILGTPFLGK